MSCLESTTDWYRDVGKDYVKDIDGNVNVRLAYAYDTPPSRVDKGDQPFFLTSVTTLVTEKIDILHHAQSSLEGKPLALKRSIQASDGLGSYFTKITGLMHRNLLSWYEDDLVIAKDMVDNAAELEKDQGRSGLCTCTYSPTVTSFMALNEYESLLSSLSIQEIRSCDRITGPRHVARFRGCFGLRWNSMTVAGPRGRCNPEEHAPIVGTT
jgi:hypothetical protein